MRLLLEQLLLEPLRHRRSEGRKAARSECDIGFDQTLELEERLVVEGDRVDVGKRHAGGLETELNRVPWKVGVMLAAGEAFLLGRRVNVAVDNQRRGAVVIERGDSQHPHRAAQKSV